MSENDLQDGCSVSSRQLGPTEQVMVDYATAVAHLGHARVLWYAVSESERERSAWFPRGEECRVRTLLREAFEQLLDKGDHVGAFASLAAARDAWKRKPWLEIAVEQFRKETEWLERKKGELCALARS